ncbi:MAG: cytochrome o ubiquinol oxidase subunit IV [Rhodovulum sulfidophilum]|uniref:Cytochrome bo(3) ubiquinol oxidase subunit 4 n=1 Tax=Rhodovulum sulfidophilum TaxID=35806 RepID=A0A2W5NGD2_RHOSU|nr:MAG: cytochrome o ubiquinol oxidase subunit IV [Rhodovulum sulfidophilum]
MSAGHPEGAHDDAHHHDAHAAPHGTREDYMRGFVLSVILTAIPFALVMFRPIDSAAYTAAIVLFCAVVQILVHMVYFLHMTPKAEGGWLLLSTVFTVVLVVITLAGSLWIIFHLNRNMMPAMGDMPAYMAPAEE